MKKEDKKTKTFQGKVKKGIEDFEKKVQIISPSIVKVKLPEFNSTKAIEQIARTTQPNLVGGQNRFVRTGYFTDEFVEGRTKEVKWLNFEN